MPLALPPSPPIGGWAQPRGQTWTMKGGMRLDVNSATSGRTATLSLKTAFERLGFGDCCHMYDVYSHPDHATAWLRANAGEAVNLGRGVRGLPLNRRMARVHLLARAH
jgi:hypothetical protein